MYIECAIIVQIKLCLLYLKMIKNIFKSIRLSKNTKLTFKQFSSQEEKVYTSFGFKTVKKEDRQTLVNKFPSWINFMAIIN